MRQDTNVTQLILSLMLCSRVHDDIIFIVHDDIIFIVHDDIIFIAHDDIIFNVHDDVIFIPASAIEMTSSCALAVL